MTKDSTFPLSLSRSAHLLTTLKCGGATYGFCGIVGGSNPHLTWAWALNPEKKNDSQGLEVFMPPLSAYTCGSTMAAWKVLKSKDGKPFTIGLFFGIMPPPQVRKRRLADKPQVVYNCQQSNKKEQAPKCLLFGITYWQFQESVTSTDLRNWMVQHYQTEKTSL